MVLNNTVREKFEKRKHKPDISKGRGKKVMETTHWLRREHPMRSAVYITETDMNGNQKISRGKSRREGGAFGGVSRTVREQAALAQPPGKKSWNR